MLGEYFIGMFPGEFSLEMFYGILPGELFLSVLINKFPGQLGGQPGLRGLLRIQNGGAEISLANSGLHEHKIPSYSQTCIKRSPSGNSQPTA